MAERQTEWELHRAGRSTAHAASVERSEELQRLCLNGRDPLAAQAVREEVVEGIRHEALLRRIEELLARGPVPEYVRFTRRFTERGWRHLQGHPYRLGHRAG